MSQDPKKNYSESKLMNALFARYINVILLLTNENTTTYHNILYLEWPVLNIFFIVSFEPLRELAMKLEESMIGNVSVYCVSPGWCKTNLHRNTIMPWYTYILAIPIAAVFMKSAKKVSNLISTEYLLFPTYLLNDWIINTNIYLTTYS